MVPTFELFRWFYSLKRREGWYFFQSRVNPLVAYLFNSHKSWRGKFIRLKLPGGFRAPLKLDVADKSPNRFSKATKVEWELFIKVQAMFFSGKLVKNQTKVKKYWHVPLIVARVGKDFYVIFAAQIEEPSGTSSTFTSILLFSFEPLPWNEIYWLLTLHFCYHSGEMAELFSIDDVVKVVQENAPAHKCANKRLVKTVFFSQDAGNNQSASVNSQATVVRRCCLLPFFPLSLPFKSLGH